MGVGERGIVRAFVDEPNQGDFRPIRLHEWGTFFEVRYEVRPPLRETTENVFFQLEIHA